MIRPLLLTGIAVAAWCGAVMSSAPIAAASAPKTSVATASFARGIVALAKQERSHDPLAFMRLTGVVLRNPNKWSDQPDGTYRTARWRNPQNRAGVLSVIFHDTVVSDGREIAFSADVALQGAPCVTISQIERAAGRKVSHGGIAAPVVYDAPAPPPYELGKQHASLAVVGRSGRSTLIQMIASKPGPYGCLKGITLSTTRSSTVGTK